MRIWPRFAPVRAVSDEGYPEPPHPIELRADAMNHRLSGRMTNGPAWRQGRHEIVSFCACGRSFYGRNVRAADAMLDAHRERQRKGTDV